MSPLFMSAPVLVEEALEKNVLKIAPVLYVMFWLTNFRMLRKCLVIFKLQVFMEEIC